MSIDKIKRRDWMIVARERRGMTAQELAVKAGCSEELISHIETAGYITHPHIACRIVHSLKLRGQIAVKRYNELISDRHWMDKLPE